MGNSIADFVKKARKLGITETRDKIHGIKYKTYIAETTLNLGNFYFFIVSYPILYVVY